MTAELFHQARHAISACPKHQHLDGNAFDKYARNITAEAFRKQAAPVALLPTAIMNGIR